MCELLAFLEPLAEPEMDQRGHGVAEKHPPYWMAMGQTTCFRRQGVRETAGEAEVRRVRVGALVSRDGEEEGVWDGALGVGFQAAVEEAARLIILERLPFDGVFDEDLVERALAWAEVRLQDVRWASGSKKEALLECRAISYSGVEGAIYELAA